MNKLAQMFNYQDGQQVRTVSIDSKPWFVIKDVCNILEITNVTETLKRLEEDEFSTTDVIDSIGRSQEVYIVNEYGLYSLVMTSRKKQAKEFKRWVTHDVLPSIRQTGAYVQVATETPELLQKVNDLETKLNSFVTLDSHEQQLLQKAIARRIYLVIETPDLRKLAFAELHREIRDRFGVPSYRDVAKLDFQKGLQYIAGWIPRKIAS